MNITPLHSCVCGFLQPHPSLQPQQHKRIDFLGQGSRSTAFEFKSALFFFPRIQPLPVFLIRECLLAGYQRERAEKERACAIQRPTPRSLLPHSSTELREPDAAVSRDPDHIRDRARVFMSYTGRVRGF